MVKRTAFVFPGQGSQTVGMGTEFQNDELEGAGYFKHSRQQLGFDLPSICWNGPTEELNETTNTQPALLIHSTALLHHFRRRFPLIKPIMVAGHSMGEIPALVAAAAINFTTALGLARERGRLMKKAGDLNNGGMAAILGLGVNEILNICDDLSRNNEVVEVANDNSPGQVVISGTATSLENALIRCKEAGAKRAIRLAVSIPAHSSLMADIIPEYSSYLDQIEINPPEMPVIGNVTAMPLSNPEQIRNELVMQLTQRVRWTDCVRKMCELGVNRFVEIGNGSVLTGLIKRIEPSVETINISCLNDIDQFDDIVSM